MAETILNDIKNHLTLKEVLGEDAINNSKLLKLVADKKLYEIADAFNGMKIGELMGYVEFTVEYDAVNDKYVISDTGTAMWFTEVSAAEMATANLYATGGATKYYTVDESSNNVYYKYADDKMAQILSWYTVNQLVGAENIDRGYGPVSFTEDVIDQVTESFTVRDILGDTVVNSNTILTLLADKKVGDLADEINDMFLGEMMGYTHEVTGHYATKVKPAPANSTWAAATNWEAQYTDGTWYYQDLYHGMHVVTSRAQLDEVHANAIYKVSANAEDEALYGTWKDGGADVTDKLTLILADIRISDIGDGFAASMLNDIKYNLTLRDVMGAAVENNKLLSLVADYTIDEIDDHISDVYIGQIMAPAGKTYVVKDIVFTDKDHYHFDTVDPANNNYQVLFEETNEANATLMCEDTTTKYHEGATYYKYVDSELSQVIGCYKISEVNDANFTDHLVDDILDKVTVGTIYPDAGMGTGFMSLLDPDWKLADMTTNLNTTLTTASVGTFMNLGIVDLTNENKAMLDDLYAYDYANNAWDKVSAPDVRGYWTGKTMSALISSMIDNITPYATNLSYYNAIYAGPHADPDDPYKTTVFNYFTYVNGGGMANYQTWLATQV